MNKKSILLIGLYLVGFFLSLSAREFPICMYGVNDVKYLKLLQKTGFSCIQTYIQKPETLSALAQQARKLGLKTVFHPQEVLGSPFEEQAKNWPMLAWYLVDEPDVWKWSRQKVLDIHVKTKQAWPKHETTLVIGQGRTRIPYYDLPDNMMVDWYPVPHLELTSFGDNVAWTKAGMNKYGAGERALWGVVQIFNWKEFKQHRPDHDRIGRFPTKEEIRFMAYDAILQGATGLFFFNFYSLDKVLPEASEENWQRVVAVIHELVQMRPILEKGVLLPNSTEVAMPLHMQSWQYKKHMYTILINRSNAIQPVPQHLRDSPYKRLFTHAKETNIEPYGVWVLKK